MVKQKTAGDRFRRALRRVADWCQRYRHAPVREQWVALKQKLLGHYGYFGTSGNSRALNRFLYRATRAWALLAQSPLAASLHLVGPNGAPAATVSVAAAAHPLCPGHVAKPCAEEPDATISHVRLRGSLGE